MLKKLLIMLLILLYFVGEGATEGYTWADPVQRMENSIIRGNTEGEGILDYHGYRTLETIFVLFASFLILGLGGLGTSVVGLFIYERILNYIDLGVLFKPPGWEYHVVGMTFKRYPVQDYLALVLGVGLIAYYFINKEKR
jgi:hypothetical protein